MTDARLRALYASVLNRQTPAIGLAWRSVERLLALIERRGSDDERLRTLDAVMRDRDGIIELEILRAAVNVRRPNRHGRQLMVAAAALLLLSVGLGQFAIQRSRIDDRPRGDRVPLVQLLAPGEQVGGVPITFSWSAVGGARDYEIEVLDADGLSAFVSTVRGTSVRLPSTVRLTPGQEYRWWVVARRADGTRVGAVPRRLRLDGDIKGGASSTGAPSGSPPAMLARAPATVHRGILS